MSIQLFVPTYNVDECLKEIKECLEIGWTGMGFKTNVFEEKWKEYTGHENAHFLNSATSGLYLAFEIMKKEYDWTKDTEIITTGLTFVSSNHAILLSDLKPVFADINDTLCLDPYDVQKKITKKTKAILYVGIGGNTGDFEKIVELCKRYKLKLILDAAHMAGTKINGTTPGLDADVTVYSFQAVKNLPTADSGMICFKDKKLDTIARKMAWLGINKDTYSRTSSKGNYKWMYDVEYLGQKYHGNSIMASIGIVQIKYLDKDNEYRRLLADLYTKEFIAYPNKIKLIRVPKNCESSRHLFQIIVEDRDGLIEYLNNKQIYPGVHYRDNTEYKMYKNKIKDKCKQTSFYSDRILSLPLHLRLSKNDIKTITKNIIEYVKK